MLAREQAVLFFRELVQAGVTNQAAFDRTVVAFRFSSSESSIRRWTRSYSRLGFPGLGENKMGRVGRKGSKNFAPAVPRCGSGANPRSNIHESLGCGGR